MSNNSKHYGTLSPEYALLGLLYNQPSHGYDLHQKLATELGFVWHISQSQAYNILKRLEKQGDISSTLVEQEKLPARQMLAITEQGREKFRQWFAAPSGYSIRSIRLEFLTRLYFAQNICPEKIAGMLAQQAAEINVTILRLETSQAELPAGQTFNQLSLRLRIQQLQSALDWLEECRAALA